MGEAVLNYPVQRIIPRNGTYALYDRIGNNLITLPSEAVSEIIQKHGDILEDLANENLERTVYWTGDQITIYSMRQPNENMNPAPVLYIQKDNQIRVMLEREAVDLMIRMTKIIRHHEQNDRSDEWSLDLNTQKRLDIDIRGDRLTIVDERHGERAVTFPLMVLAYLWTCYGVICRELNEEHLNETTFWRDNNLTIKRRRLPNSKFRSYYNVLHFQSGYAYMSIIPRTFTELLQEMAGEYFTDEVPREEPEELMAMGMAENKGFQFPVPGHPNHFRIRNERQRYYNLPTAALDAAIARIDEINNYLQGNGDDEYSEYWSDEDYVMHVSNLENQPRGIDVRTIKFVRRRGCFLLVAYTEETFGGILEEYRRNRRN